MTQIPDYLCPDRTVRYMNDPVLYVTARYALNLLISNYSILISVIIFYEEILKMAL